MKKMYNISMKRHRVLIICSSRIQALATLLPSVRLISSIIKEISLQAVMNRDRNMAPVLHANESAGHKKIISTCTEKSLLSAKKERMKTTTIETMPEI